MSFEARKSVEKPPKNFYSSNFYSNLIGTVYIKSTIPASNYLFKVNNKNTRTRCSIYSKLTIEKPE